MTNLLPRADTEIAEIRRRIVERRKNPASVAPWKAARSRLGRRTDDHDQLSDDLYRQRTGKVRPDTR